MRTGTKKCILLLLAIIVLCFAVWLLWPHSFAEVTGIPAEYPDLNMPPLSLLPGLKTAVLRLTSGTYNTVPPEAQNMKLFYPF